jgi:hypothetical protein
MVPGSQQKNPKFNLNIFQVEFEHTGKFVTEVLQSLSKNLINWNIQAHLCVHSPVGQQYAVISSVAMHDWPLGQHSSLRELPLLPHCTGATSGQPPPVPSRASGQPPMYVARGTIS